MNANPAPWSKLGAVAPRRLTSARLAAHYAAQPLAAAAYDVLPMLADHSHTVLLWSAERGRFEGRPLPAGHVAFLDVEGLRIGLRGEAAGGDVATLSLTGQTLEQAFAFLQAALGEAGEGVSSEPLAVPDYDLPDAPLAQGGKFPRGGTAARAALARWFGNGAAVLGELAAKELEGAELRAWPHHFDLASLLVFDAEADPESARSIGVGLSPGDGTYDQPYFYVTPWPAPAPTVLPSLVGAKGLARWHTDGFTSAVILGSDVVALGTADAQHAGVRAALRACVETCRSLLGG